MPPLAVAAVGAAVGIGGAVLSANAQKKAANKAADAQGEASEANIALAKETYASNAQRLDPTINQGLTAGNALMGLLGFNTPAPAPVGGTASGPVGTAPPEPTYSTFAKRNAIHAIQSGQTLDPARLEQFGLTDYAAKYKAWKQGPTATPPINGTGSNSALSAWDTFRNSSNYKFRFDQGVEAIQQGMGALGSFDSGATRKALTEYGQNFASNEIGSYMDRLAQQQGFGLSGASALAGVSQNMAGAQMAANNNTATAAGNAALISGAANQNMYGQIAGALGGLASSFGKR